MPKLIRPEGAFAELLLQKGLTAYSLSRLSGVGEPTLRKLVKGSATVRLHVLAKLASRLGVTVPDLIAMAKRDGVLIRDLPTQEEIRKPR